MIESTLCYLEKDGKYLMLYRNKKEKDPTEKGMKVVNTLFFLSMLLYRSGFIFIAYAAWIVYLSFCIRKSESKGSKTIYSVFIGLAAVMIWLNFYFLISG